MHIAVVGNCHAGIVAQAVRAALRDVPGLVCRHVVSYQAAGEEDRRFIEAADRILLQVMDFKSRGDVAAVLAERSDRIGRFPLIAGNFLYPHAGKAHPKAAASRSYFCPSGHFEAQISDTLLIDLMERHEGEPADAIVDRWMALDVPALVDLDRLFEINQLKMTRLGDAAGFDLWPKIARSFRDVPVFWTYLHPTGVLMRDLCRHALTVLGLGLSAEAIEAAILDVKEPFGFAHMPIHPSIVRHFGIEWARPSTRYKFMPLGGFTDREFARRFVTFTHDDDLHRAVFDIHADIGLDSAIATLEAKRRDYPASGEILINLSVGHWKQGRLAQAMEAVVTALEREPQQAEWAAFLCILARQAGAIAGAGLQAAA